jgi:hypothetical protein
MALSAKTSSPLSFSLFEGDEQINENQITGAYP